MNLLQINSLGIPKHPKIITTEEKIQLLENKRNDGELDNRKWLAYIDFDGILKLVYDISAYVTIIKVPKEFFIARANHFEKGQKKAVFYRNRG